MFRALLLQKLLASRNRDWRVGGLNRPPATEDVKATGVENSAGVQLPPSTQCRHLGRQARPPTWASRL